MDNYSVTKAKTNYNETCYIVEQDNIIARRQKPRTAFGRYSTPKKATWSMRQMPLPRDQRFNDLITSERARRAAFESSNELAQDNDSLTDSGGSLKKRKRKTKKTKRRRKTKAKRRKSKRKTKKQKRRRRRRR